MPTETHPSRRRCGRRIFPPLGAGQTTTVSGAVRWIPPILVVPAKRPRPNPEMSRRGNPRRLKSAPNPTWRLWSNRWLSPVPLVQQRSLRPTLTSPLSPTPDTRFSGGRARVLSGPVVFESNAAACCPDTTPARGPTAHLHHDIIHKSRCLPGAHYLFQRWFCLDE